MRGFTEGNSRFMIDWASLMVGSKFIVFALFYFVFKGNFPSTSPRVFCVIGLGGLYLEGLIHGRAFFRNFTVAFVPPRKSWNYDKNYDIFGTISVTERSCAAPLSKVERHILRGIGFVPPFVAA